MQVRPRTEGDGVATNCTLTNNKLVYFYNRHSIQYNISQLNVKQDRSGWTSEITIKKFIQSGAHFILSNQIIMYQESGSKIKQKKPLKGKKEISLINKILNRSQILFVMYLYRKHCLSFRLSLTSEQIKFIIYNIFFCSGKGFNTRNIHSNDYKILNFKLTKLFITGS